MTGSPEVRYESAVSTIEQKHHQTGCACRGTTIAKRGRTVSVRLERDHRELDAVLNEAGSLAREGDFFGAQQVFAKLRRRLDAHIVAEEEVLFPIYEQVSDCDAPTNVMLGEHADIRRLMATIADDLQTPSSLALVDAIPELTRLLSVHNAREERTVYPDTDAGLELDHEREALVARIEERLER